MKRFAIFVVLALVALSLLGVSSAANPPLAGSLDPSFGSRGVITHHLGSGEYPAIRGIAVQPDGKVVVAGGSGPGDHGLLLARYLPDGSPDPSFGDGGYVETHVTYWAFANAVALQPDGKIVAAGDSWQGDDNNLGVFTLARYNPDGSLDTSFGTDGITNTDIPESVPPTNAIVNAVALLPSGEILVAGSAAWGDPQSGQPSSFVLARYRSDGSLDPTFGAGGIVQTQFNGDDRLDGIAVQPNGKIVASGSSTGAGYEDYRQSMAVARYETDGSLDPTFGNGGEVTTALKLRGYNGGPTTLQNGKIVVAGFTSLKLHSNDFPVLARFEASGRLDPTFGKHGFEEIRSVKGDANLQGDPTDVVAQRNGKLLIAAANSIIRLTPNGRLDKSFGKGGIVSLTGGVATTTLASEADGKVVVGGYNGNTVDGGGSTAWFLARLLAGNNCVVPALRGKTVPKANTTLKNSYCGRGRIAKRLSAKVTRGRVIATTPRRNARLPRGTKIDLVVSKGTRP